MRSVFFIIAEIALGLLLPTLSVAAEWKRITDPPAAPQNMVLLTNGDVMALTSDRGPNSTMPDRSQVWMRLSPDVTGDYSNGSWRFTAPMSIPRLFFASNVVRDGRLIVLGGEYSGIGLQNNVTNTGEAYDPATDTWAPIAPHPEAHFGDDPTMLLDGDRILAGSLFTRNTWIYHYLDDRWEENPIPKAYNDRSDEETWVKLPGGRILTYDLFQSTRIPDGQFAEIFDPLTNEWQSASPSDGTAGGFIPQLSASQIGFELGGALQTPRRMKRRNGSEEIFYIGATGHTAVYNPFRNEWRSGPDILGEVNGISGLFGADDAPAAALPTGQIIFAADAGPIHGDTFFAPARLFIYDPELNAVSQLSTPFDSHLDTLPSYVTRLLVLPTGQILYGDMRSTEMWLFTGDGTAPGGVRPKVDDVVLGPEGSNSFTVIGRELNGASAGSSYGDDVESDENFPIVYLTSKGGSVFYATTSYWSNTEVGNRGDQTVDFILPEALPADRYRLFVSGAGIQSKPFCVNLKHRHLRNLFEGESISCQNKDDRDNGNGALNIANK